MNELIPESVVTESFPLSKKFKRSIKPKVNPSAGFIYIFVKHKSALWNDKAKKYCNDLICIFGISVISLNVTSQCYFIMAKKKLLILKMLTLTYLIFNESYVFNNFFHMSNIFVLWNSSNFICSLSTCK